MSHRRSPGPSRQSSVVGRQSPVGSTQSSVVSRPPSPGIASSASPPSLFRGGSPPAGGGERSVPPASPHTPRGRFYHPRRVGANLALPTPSIKSIETTTHPHRRPPRPEGTMKRPALLTLRARSGPRLGHHTHPQSMSRRVRSCGWVSGIISHADGRRAHHLDRESSAGYTRPNACSVGTPRHGEGCALPQLAFARDGIHTIRVGGTTVATGVGGESCADTPTRK